MRLDDELVTRSPCQEEKLTLLVLVAAAPRQELPARVSGGIAKPMTCVLQDMPLFAITAIATPQYGIVD
jgi:hypothetical protein